MFALLLCCQIFQTKEMRYEVKHELSEGRPRGTHTITQIFLDPPQPPPFSFSINEHMNADIPI